MVIYQVGPSEKLTTMARRNHGRKAKRRARGGGAHLPRTPPPRTKPPVQRVAEGMIHLSVSIVLFRLTSAATRAACGWLGPVDLSMLVTVAAGAALVVGAIMTTVILVAVINDFGWRAYYMIPRWLRRWAIPGVFCAMPAYWAKSARLAIVGMVIAVVLIYLVVHLLQWLTWRIGDAVQRIRDETTARATAVTAKANNRACTICDSPAARMQYHRTCAKYVCDVCAVAWVRATPAKQTWACCDAPKGERELMSVEADALAAWQVTIAAKTPAYRLGPGEKACPSCGIAIEKISGCDRMTCTECGHVFCWRCRASWSLFHDNCY